MVQALVELDEGTNRVLNMVKAKYDFKDKGETIKFIVTEYAEMEGEPELKLEFIEKMQVIIRQRTIKVVNFAQRYGIAGH